MPALQPSAAGFTRPPARYLRWAGLCLSLCLSLSLAPLLWWLLIKPSGTAVELAAKTWRLDIEIEKLLEEGESSWCDEMPAEARKISRRLLTDPAGVRAAPSEHCRFSLPQWRTLRIVRAEGAWPVPPLWPNPKLNGLAADQLGAERAGKREAFYELQLRAESGQAWTCRLPPTQWLAHKLGARYRLQVDRFSVADCASLPKSD